MKKYVFFIVLIVSLSCTKDKEPKAATGDSIVSAVVLSWDNVGEICGPPNDVNGLASLQVTFNGSVPNSGNLILQSRWKLPEDTEWNYEEPNTRKLSLLTNRSGNSLTVSNGYCWGLDNSIISCEFTYEAANGDESSVVVITIPRPE